MKLDKKKHCDFCHEIISDKKAAFKLLTYITGIEPLYGFAGGTKCNFPYIPSLDDRKKIKKIKKLNMCRECYEFTLGEHRHEIYKKVPKIIKL